MHTNAQTKILLITRGGEMNKNGEAQSKSPLTVLKWAYLNGNRPTELCHYVHFGLIITDL